MITAHHNQTLVDAALQLHGDAAKVFALAVAMGAAITDDLTAGDVISPAGEITSAQKAVAAMLSKVFNMPASGDGLTGAAALTVGSIVQLLQDQPPAGNMVQHGQCLVDMAMQYNGDASTLFSLAASLGASITDDVDAGGYLEMPAGEISSAQKAVATMLSKVFNIPASGDGLTGAAAFMAGSFVHLLPTPAEVGNMVQHGQCLVDMAMQYNGDASMLFSLATSLGLSMTEIINAGSFLDIPADDLPAPAKPVVTMLNRRHNIPASFMDIDGPPVSQKLEGIDYWFVWEYVVQ